MNFLQPVIDWIIGFFGVGELIKIIQSGKYDSLLTKDGIISIIGPLFPIFVFLELGKALIFRKFKAIDYKIPFFSYVLNAIIGRFISIAAVVFCIELFGKYAIIKIPFNWYWLI